MIDGYYIKRIGQNRGAPRIWLDRQTERAGFEPGQRYDVVVQGRTVRVGRDSCISRQNDPKAMIQKGISDQDRILRRHAARIRIRSPSASASPITGQERY